MRNVPLAVFAAGVRGPLADERSLAFPNRDYKGVDMALRANKPDEDADSRCGAGLRPCGWALPGPERYASRGESVFRGA
ncbi:MAG TPA: hypothetical protein VHY84_10950, partial [Bryobacteraceae bacterium]|nr:hypothetical protein [Bryobacteraceae bacterium]